MSESAIAGLAFLGTGALCLLIGGIFFFRSRRFLSWAADAQGTVTDMVARASSEGGTVYSPVVQFATQEGQDITFTESVGSYPPKYKAGDMVKVKYLPAEPQKARIPSWFRMWFVPTLVGGMGLLFAPVGAVLYLTAPDKPKEDPAVTALPGLENLPSGILPSGLPSIAIPSPGALPSIPGVGQPILAIQEGSNPPRLVPTTCASIEGTGKTRKVHLDVSGDSVRFTAKPYKGPGSYLPGQNLTASGSLFADGAAISGAVIFDDTGKSGVLNLTAGSLSLSGIWDCTSA